MDVLETVRKLMDRANHPAANENERELCIKKADDLMSKHSIDEAMLNANRDPSERRKPIHREFRAWDTYAWRSVFHNILFEIARTVGVKSNIRFDGNVSLVGMSDDVNYCEMLWTQTYFTFMSRLEPSWDDRLSFEHNVYNFKVAGRKWAQICASARTAGHWVDWPDGGRLIRAYKRHCKIIGEEPTNHTQRHDVYREAFSRAFENTVCSRLVELRVARKTTAEESGPGTALVLVARDDEVNEAYWALFPDEHPETVRKNHEKFVARYQKQRDGEERERAEMLDAMTDKQRAAFLDKEARAEQREAERNDRYWQQREARSRDSDGSRAGRRAGQSVDLSRKAGAADSSKTAGEL